MRAGNLDKVILIERPTTTLPNADGTVVLGWTTVATMRAQLLSISTDEFIRGQGASTETVITFRIRWLDDVTPANRVIYQSQAYDIKETKELGRRRGLDIRCVRSGP